MWKAKVDLEYRWFLGIPLGKNTPHYSTFSQNYIRRFKDTDIFEKIFVNIVEQAIKYNLVKGETFLLILPTKKLMLIKINFILKLLMKLRKEDFG